MSILSEDSRSSIELGDDASARDALNQVRRRAKLDDVTASGKALQSAIRQERRLELASSRTGCMIFVAGLIQMVKR